MKLQLTEKLNSLFSPDDYKCSEGKLDFGHRRFWVHFAWVLRKHDAVEKRNLSNYLKSHISICFSPS